MSTIPRPTPTASPETLVNNLAPFFTKITTKRKEKKNKKLYLQFIFIEKTHDCSQTYHKYYGMNTNYGEIPLRNCGTVKNFNLFKEKTKKGDQKRDENQKGPIYQRSHGSKIVQRHLIWRVVSDFVRFSSIGFSFF